MSAKETVVEQVASSSSTTTAAASSSSEPQICEVHPTETKIFGDPKLGPNGTPTLSNHPDIWSEYTLLKTMTLTAPTQPLLGHRAFVNDEPTKRGDFIWETRQQALDRVHKTASSLKDLSKDSKKPLIIAFLCKGSSRPDWHVVFGACSLIGAVMVPLSIAGSTTPDDIAPKLIHSETNIIFSSVDKLDLVAHTLPLLPKEQKVTVVAMDSFSCEPKQLEAMAAAGKKCWDIRQSELEARGSAFACCQPAPAEQDALFMYTSGTTGNPKCVVLSQRSAVSGSVALIPRVPEIAFHLKDLFYLSFLPLSHVFGIFIDTAAIRFGASIGYYSGDLSLMPEDIAILRPAAVAFVPRVYNKIYEGVMAKIGALPWYKRAAFWSAYAWKKSWLVKGDTMHGCWVDKAIFKEIRERFGGRLEIMICGGAPVYTQVGEFFRVVCCDLFMEGFGLSETSACGMSRREEDGVSGYGHCGVPYCNTQIKLRSVPEYGLDALANPPRGELLIRTLHGFTRYHKDPELTKQVLDSEGWIHTGDVAEITPSGNIKVVDRIKQLFKLSQGEYISAEYVERSIAKSLFVEDVFVTGSSLNRFPVAIIVPRKDTMTAWAKKPGSGVEKLADDFEGLCKTQQANKLIMAEIERFAKEDGLKGYEKPAAIYLDSVTFEAANKGLITATLKLKRNLLSQYYQQVLEKLYATVAK